MKILNVNKNVDWLSKPNECSQILDKQLPPIDLITTAFCFVFHEEKLLLANLYRGWDTPGGHVESGESPIETVHREVYEETCITIEYPQVIGYQRLYIQAEKPKNYRYPFPTSYQVHYVASVKEIHPFTSNDETKGRGFFTLSELSLVPNVKERWELLLMAYNKTQEK